MLLLAAVAASCRQPPPAAPAKPTGPPYVALFQLDRAWSLPVEVAAGHKQGSSYALEHSARGSLNCKVSSVRTFGDATVAHVACDPPMADLLAAGTWVQTPAGLFHPVLPMDDAEDIANLGDEDMLIAAIPVERHHDHAIDQTKFASDAFELAAGWCIREISSGGDTRRGFTLCFDASGVTGGDDLLIAGEQWRRSRFGQPVPDPEDPTGE